MSNPESAGPIVPPPLEGDKTMAVVVYALYLAALVSGVTALIGVVLAYVSKDGAPDWLKSHYQFQIRTFWIGLAAGVIGMVTVIVGIGVLILIAAGVWTAVRSIIGLSKVLKNEAYPNPQSWTI